MISVCGVADAVWPTAQELLEDELNCMIALETFAEVANEGPHKLKHPVAVIEAAVLLKAGWHREVDEVWVTSAPAEVVFERLIGRGLTPDEAEVDYFRSMRWLS
jgi:dephospho-CoA kinase